MKWLIGMQSTAVDRPPQPPTLEDFEKVVRIHKRLAWVALGFIALWMYVWRGLWPIV